MNKICSKCGEEKDIEFFKIRYWKNKQLEKIEYRMSHCNTCENRIKYDRIRSNPESLEKYKERMRIKAKKQHSKDPEGTLKRGRQFVQSQKEKGTWRDRWLRDKYGISLDDYNNMKLEQEESCKICKRPASMFKKPLHVDHCHTTGKVRGLLCFNCNSGLGSFLDNKESLRSAINYLESSM